MKRQTESKILLAQELWVDFRIRKMYPGCLAHHIADAKQVSDHVRVVLYRSGQAEVVWYFAAKFPWIYGQ